MYFTPFATPLCRSDTTTNNVGYRNTNGDIRDDDDDSFYNVDILLPFLLECLDWRRSFGGIYVVGGSPHGLLGQLGRDYFHHPQDIVDYCRKHRYKERYADCFKRRQSSSSCHVTPKRCLTQPEHCSRKRARYAMNRQYRQDVSSVDKQDKASWQTNGNVENEMDCNH